MTPEWEAAAIHGDVDALSSMLDCGADPNALDSHGQTALMLAAHRGHHEVVHRLIAAGADLDRIAKFGLTAATLAVVSGQESIARLLADPGADLGAQGSGAPGFGGKFAADVARDRGQEELARALSASSPNA